MSVSMRGGQPRLEKAYLKLVPPSIPGGGGLLAGIGAAVGGSSGAAAGGMADSALGTGGGAGGGAGLGRLDFHFNPKSYSVQKAANWSRNPVAGAQAGPVQFTGSGPRSLSLEIFLDESSSANGSVVSDVELLFSCCTPTAASLAANQPSPPFVLFGWGRTVSFLAFVKSVNITYTMFRPDGTPYRAKGNLALEEVFNPTPGQNPTSGSLAARRSHIVHDGDSLPSIAYREYRNPNLWRAIAEANGIDDPSRIAPGQRLLLPAPTEAAQVS